MGEHGHERAGDLLTKMSPEQRLCLGNGPVFRAHQLKTELITAATLEARAERFYAAMQHVAPPSPAMLIPTYVLLCQQMTLLVRSLDKGSRRINTGVVFAVRVHSNVCGMQNQQVDALIVLALTRSGVFCKRCCRLLHANAVLAVTHTCQA